MSWQVLLIIALLGIVNVVATAKVLRSELLTPRRRKLQVMLIWLVPVVGAIICSVFAGHDRPTRDLTRDPNFHPAQAHLDIGPSSQSAADGD